MTSSNPVLSRQEFRRERGRKVTARGPVGEMSTRRREGARPGGGPAPGRELSDGLLAQPVGALMTMDAVIGRTALALMTVMLTAVLSWTVPPVAPTNLGVSYGIAGMAALVACALTLLQARTVRVPSVLVLAYAAVQGVFLGVVSNTVSTHMSAGVVVQTVLGTMTAFAGVLIAYRLHWIRMTRRFHGFAGGAALGLVLLAAVDLLFSMCTSADGLGFRSGVLGIALGVLGVVMGACFLALHVRQVEDGVTFGVAAEESWRAAFGLTLTLVWLYVEAGRLFTLVREDDVY
ncbi:Bax inhibitor-1/YccA family protein [Streptomyces sp. NBC_01341]|uniref:Bax inhibitor-1/YccA family protein n=1 Tax=Streptomyces sp. NBC_01341 TaxID=2903831 RepID=UPI002E0DFF69|nr:Bax inhibitor-1/YccA family protein [Streptomyces sp. NBC_01341]